MPITKHVLPAVAAIIFNAQGDVLLQKRRDVQEWGLLGGHVEFGESVEQAICREILEETGSAVRIIRLIGVYSEPQSQLYTYATRTVHYVTTYFEGELLQEPATGFTNEETVELRYFPVQELPTELAVMNPFWLSDALARQASAFIR